MPWRIAKQWRERARKGACMPECAPKPPWRIAFTRGGLRLGAAADGIDKHERNKNTGRQRVERQGDWLNRRPMIGYM